MAHPKMMEIIANNHAYKARLGLVTLTSPPSWRELVRYWVANTKSEMFMRAWI